MSQKNRVAIIGAGFSGLTLARSLVKYDFAVEVFESKSNVGGLIQTTEKPIMVEYAAHAILASQEVEELFAEVGLKPQRGGFKSKAKWIYRGRPTHWPFSWSETFQVVPKLVSALFNKSKRPKERETLKEWTDRNAISLVQNFLFGPGFQGVYGGDSDKLSASLVLGSMFRKDLKSPQGKLRGSLAPWSGMHELLKKLYGHLEEKGVKFHFGQDANIEELGKQFDAVVVATSLKSAASILEKNVPKFANEMKSLPTVSLATVTFGFDKLGQRIRGFGCLFPQSEGFSSLGVLFNTDLFPNRGELESETWILGGDKLKSSDSELIENILEERKKLGADPAPPKTWVINRLPDVLPKYGLALERFLTSKGFRLNQLDVSNSPLEVLKQGACIEDSSFPLYLSGNYLGGIGLTKILSYNNRLAERLKRDLQGGL